MIVCYLNSYQGSNVFFVLLDVSSYEHLLVKREVVDTGSPSEHIGRAPGAICALWSARQALEHFSAGVDSDDYTRDRISCVSTGKMASAVCPFISTQPGHVQGTQQATDREHNIKMLQRIGTSRRHRACVTHLSALYCCDYSNCVCRSLRSVIHHLPLFAAVCDTPRHSVGRCKDRLDYI